MRGKAGPSAFLAALTIPFLAATILAGCHHQSASTPTVVMYCSVDEVFARPIIAKLEAQTGITIEPLFDVEAAKTAGLANKIRAEHNRPRADLFWASTVLQTEMLAHEGMLARYTPPTATDIPAPYRDPDGVWTAVGIRARVLVCDHPEGPHPLSYIPPGAGSRFAISNPQFGTGSDWAAAYGARWGTQLTAAHFDQLRADGVRVLPGNADVALAVANGNIDFGIIDSDDYLNQLKQGKPIYLVHTTSDNVLVPGTAAVVAGAPHLADAEKVMDALVSAPTEAAFVAGMPGLFSIRHLNTPAGWKSGGVDFGFLSKTPPDDFAKWRTSWESLRTPLADSLTP